MTMQKSAVSAFEPQYSMPKALSGFGQIRRYWDRDNGSYSAKILPGEYYVTRENELIVTTLGSCVSACIRDKVYGIGGMNHFMLPSQSTNRERLIHPSVSISNRYGSYAMENLINDILKNGGKRNNLEVKIFGGARVLANMTDVGMRNIEFVLEYIDTEALELAAKDVGSVYPRKIVYSPRTGNVRVKRLRVLHNDALAQRENRYLHDIESNAVSGKVEIFK